MTRLVMFFLLVAGCGADPAVPVHEHPPVLPLEATGNYLVTGIFSVDTCNDPSWEDPDNEMDLGEWTIALAGQEYLLLLGNRLILRGSDGHTFSYIDRNTDWWTECPYTYTYGANLEFTAVALSGDISTHLDFPACEGDYEEFICDMAWEVTGEKL